MARRKKTESKRPIQSYEHRDKQRVNNPPVGLVTPATDPDAGQKKKTYAYDPHLDPQLQWAGKAEHTSFAAPTVSLHVHEHIDPRTIIEAVKRRNGNGGPQQMTLFDTERAEPLRHAVEFYKHAHGWSNRMVAGDSLLVMNSLLEKEGMAGKVQMIYIDPPYGIRYGSNFQPFVNKRDVKDGKDEDLTAEPEQIRAFRDTWELGIHSYLTYLRDRLLLARELLTESGSVFVQISDENVHHVRELMDEVFEAANFVRLITFAKTGSMVSNELGRTSDYLVWYARDKEHLKYRQLYSEKLPDAFYSNVELPDGIVRKITRAEMVDPSLLPSGAKIFQLVSLESSGPPSEDTPLEFEGETFRPNKNSHWKLAYPDGMEALKRTGRMVKDGNKLRWKYYISDYPLKVLSEVWDDTAGFNPDQKYVVETRTKVVERCLLMTTDPGDLVFDPTCGSGTTAYVAEQWGRRWITCDTSRVALTLAKQRLMTAVFDYYELAHPQEGVGSGFKYKTVPHVTLKSIANNPDIKEGMTREQIDAAIARHAPQETLYDQPFVDKKKTRVSGPFTVEAVPAPAVKSVEELLEGAPQPADASIARSGETLRQGEWRDELLRAGIRGKSG
jgi:adenine-specific DNA-methyltransferase